MKFFMINSFLALLCLEGFLQASIFLGVTPFSDRSLYYNPYCDQNYWDFSDSQLKISKSVEPHPILSFQNKNSPHRHVLNLQENEKIESKGLAIFGSSFTGHEKFKYKFEDLFEYDHTNYSVPSYGIDQIFISYQLSAAKHFGDVVVFGFLFEDLDRAIFYKRDYEKLTLIFDEQGYSLANVPINLDKTRPVYDVFSIRMLQNISSLIVTEFDPRNNQCFQNEKKEIFENIVQEILKTAEIFKQTPIFVTFNHERDLSVKQSWRVDFVNQTLKNHGALMVSSLNELDQFLVDNTQTTISDLFNKSDGHYSSLGFGIVINRLAEVIEQHR
jgi:hypothetical protein